MPCNAQTSSFAVSVSDEDVNIRNDNDPTTTRSNAFAKEPVVSIKPAQHHTCARACILHVAGIVQAHTEITRTVEKQGAPNKTTSHDPRQVGRIIRVRCAACRGAPTASTGTCSAPRLAACAFSLRLRAGDARRAVRKKSTYMYLSRCMLPRVATSQTHPLPLNLLMPPLSLRLP
jgi:hypothetical protein